MPLFKGDSITTTPRLIREGARLVASIDDVLEELQDLFAGTGNDRNPETVVADAEVEIQAGACKVTLTDEERAVFRLIYDEGSYADNIVRESGLDTGKVNSILVSLQIKRMVRSGPGGLFMRLR